MLLITGKGIRGSVCHAIHRYAEAIISIWKIMIKTKKHNTFKI